MSKVVIACLLAAGAALIALSQSGGPNQTKRVTGPEAEAVVLAVEDEIYDYSHEKAFYMVGKEPVKGTTRLPIYIEPNLKDGRGNVIYKLMPFGEVIRQFHFRQDGLAVIEGRPDIGFPPTQPNTLTLYMDDDEVCGWKREWLRYHFDILDAPT